MKIRLENIQETFKSAYRKITIIFYRYRGKNVLIFLFFVLLSFCFWVLLSLQEDYEIQVSIPIRYKNMPPDITFVQTPPDEITARIRDKGTVLLNYTAGNHISPLDIDMKDIAGGNGQFTFSGKEIEGVILKRLISTTNLLSFDPQQINEPYSKLINKKLPVTFSGDIRTDPGFHISGEILIDPQEVDVYASNLILDTLHVITTVYEEIKKGNKTIKKSFQLEKPEGVTLEPATVSITIPIEEFTEKTLEIPVISKKVPANYTVRMFPSTVKISCSVPLSRFKELSEEAFSVEVSMENLEENVSGMLPVVLAKKPDWVDEVTLSPNNIEFILEQNNADD